ncbi:MAG: nucleotidyltransferase domain-containing protein [Arenicella sp.]
MQQTIGRVVQFVTNMIAPEQIILFGSVAAERNNQYSDVDMIIVVDDIENRSYYSDLVTQFIRRFALKADVLVHEKEEICQAKPFSFLAEAVKSGIIIYDKTIVANATEKTL